MMIIMVFCYMMTRQVTAAIDAGCAPSYLSALQETGWNMHILITHHHGDHVAGLAELKQTTNARVYGQKTPN